MHIRNARQKDAKPLAKLNMEIFHDIPSPREAKKFYSHCMKNSFPGACLVAEEKGELVGAIMAEKRLTFVPRAAEIKSLMVAKGWQGKGIGKKLLAQCLLSLKKHGIKSISLTVHPKNKTAKSLYKKAGFGLFRLMYLKKF